MKLSVTHQDSYSRGQLLLRTFFGWLYIAIPHFVVIGILSIVSGIFTFIAWFAILIMGRYPEMMYEYQVKLMRWNLRVTARLYNLCDGYPPFGLNTEEEVTTLEIQYPESLSRGILLLKTFFGWLYVGIPHGFILMFRGIGTFVLMFLAWWVVLFTGRYPENWHRFNVGTIRWQTRVNLYLTLMSDDYPPFTGEKVEDELDKEVLA
jgi:hypothetical protein